MKNFEKKINQLKFKQNSLTIIRFLLIAILLSILFFNIFFTIFNITKNHQPELFIFVLILRLLLLASIFYLLFRAIISLQNKFKIARYLDEFNHDKSDTYQNALELLHENPNTDSEILDLIYRKADRKAENQVYKPEFSQIRFLILPFVAIIIFSSIIFGFNHHKFRESLDFFSLLKLPPVQHKTYVEVSPGNISITRNNDLTIEVIEPEENIEHFLLYKTGENWREISLFENKKTFHNLDFSFDYFVKTPFAISDTFQIKVFELPAVKDITVKYDYPEYTGLVSEIDSLNNGHIKALENTKVTLEVESNNPLEEAKIIFSNSDFSVMARLGKNSFTTTFPITRNLTYHFALLDILHNRSEKISKPISVIKDLSPEIRIVSPGKDTILTQNMLLPLSISANDDYGLQELKLKYFINFNEEKTVEIQNVIREKNLQLDHIFDLTNIYLIPGDKVTYWTEISDNYPKKHTSVSRRYIARFPSIEEIYKEIEKEEEAKSTMMESLLNKSKELQDEFEEKRLEMLKKEKYDWEDKKEIEKFLEKQEDLNKDIENIAEEYQSLIEKFEDNKALSDETLQKMEKIQELMEEISNEQIEEAMKELQQKMEELDPDVLKKAMEDFKFSMEDFSKKLDQTLKLLEDIKKEQALQKALEIAEEMEEMQNDLNEKTKDQSADNEQLSEEQQNISEKLDNLEKQLQEAENLMDKEADKEVKENMDQLQEEMAQDSLQSDLEESEESLSKNEMQKAMKSQQQASKKMQKMSQQLSKMMEMMSSGSMMAMTEIVQQTIRRLLIFSEKHEESSNNYVKDPFAILSQQITNYEGINLTLQELYATPMIFFMIGPKFIYDANFTSSVYRELFQYINKAKRQKVGDHLKDIQKGLNLMIYDLMQAQNSMQQGSGNT
ncbi:MAG: hypothetical protein H8E57_01630 [Candidatus Cloacimonetes bacterium]|nr:hypothetical protein [Candidatus Cloacimonadota bacterium]